MQFPQRDFFMFALYSSLFYVLLLHFCSRKREPFDDKVDSSWVDELSSLFLFVRDSEFELELLKLWSRRWRCSSCVEVFHVVFLLSTLYSSNIPKEEHLLFLHPNSKSSVATDQWLGSSAPLAACVWKIKSRSGQPLCRVVSWCVLRKIVPRPGRNICSSSIFR